MEFIKTIIKILGLFLIAVPLAVFIFITLLNYCFDVNLTSLDKKQLLVIAELVTFIYYIFENV